jgi:hypothetical protein
VKRLEEEMKSEVGLTCTLGKEHFTVQVYWHNMAVVHR